MAIRLCLLVALLGACSVQLDALVGRSSPPPAVRPVASSAPNAPAQPAPQQATAPEPSAVALSSSNEVAQPAPVTFEKLRVTIDFPGTVAIEDTDVTGREKLSSGRVEAKTSIEDVGRIYLEFKPRQQSSKDAAHLVKAVSGDATDVVIGSLPDRGWIITWRYNANKWFGVKALKKVNGKWLLMDARPESQAALDIIVTAFKTARAA